MDSYWYCRILRWISRVVKEVKDNKSGTNQCCCCLISPTFAVWRCCKWEVIYCTSFTATSSHWNPWNNKLNLFVPLIWGIAMVGTGSTGYHFTYPVSEPIWILLNHNFHFHQNHTTLDNGFAGTKLGIW